MMQRVGLRPQVFDRAEFEGFEGEEQEEREEAPYEQESQVQREREAMQVRLLYNQHR
jgi:hypothetical protein